MRYRAVITDPKLNSEKPIQFYGQDLNKVEDEIKARLDNLSPAAYADIYENKEVAIKKIISPKRISGA